MHSYMRIVMHMRRGAAAMTVTEARAKLLRLAERFENPSAQPVDVTKHGKRVMTLVPVGIYDALLETLDILSDADTTSELRAAMASIDRGKGISWSHARRRLVR